MRVTILSEESSRVIRVVSIVAIALLPFVRMPGTADPFQPARLLAAAAAVAGLFLAMNARGETLWRGSRPGLLVTVLFAGVCAGWIAATIAGEPASSLFGVHGRFQGLTSFALSAVAGIAGFQAMRRVPRSLPVVIGVATALLSVVIIVQTATGRLPVGTLGNQVLAGAWLAVGTAVCLGGVRAERGRRRALLAALAVAGAVGLGLTGSRGAWFGLVLAAVVVVFASRVRARTLGVAALLLVVLAASGAVAGGEVASKLDPASLTRGSAAARWQIWSGTASMIAASPAIGVGPGRFLYEFPQHQPLEHALAEGVDVRPDAAHSHLLQTAAETGVPTAVALVALTLIALVSGSKAARGGDGVALIATAGLAGYVGQGLFGIGAIETDVLGWLLGGIALSRGLKAAMETEEPAHSASGFVRLVGLLACAALVAAGTVYVRADRLHAAGLASFDAARFDDAYLAQVRAVDALPIVDTYRVAASDAALFGGGALARADELLAEGLELEPSSYDMAYARARVMRADPRATLGQTADAYELAARLYPLGVEVRREAIPVLVDAGRTAEAQEMARIVLAQVPEDPVALGVEGQDD